MEFKTEEKNFLVGILTNVVPNLNVPAKDAPAMLQVAKSILDKLAPAEKKEEVL